MAKTGRRIGWAVAVAALAGATTWALRPQPVPVDLADVTGGPLAVTIDEDGQTRAHDRYSVAAPITGRLSRITLHEGDAVTPQTVIATIRPAPVDPRESAEIRAQITSFEALEKEAHEYVARAEADHQQTLRDVERYRDLQKKDVISRQTLEQAETAERRAARDLAAAKFKVQSAAAEVARARAALMSTESPASSAAVSVHPPSRARVLRILEKSERVVTAGTPLIELSNPSNLEGVVDLLSTDAVQVRPGAPVTVDGWGGAKPLRAQVRLVEPSAFTKVSALGIEEQRVNVILDFIDPPTGLGDGYRIEAHIVIWQEPNVLQVPTGALFREGDGWAAFVVDGGKALMRTVKVGQRNANAAQVLDGLQEGEKVVLHPPTELKPGGRVVVR